MSTVWRVSLPPQATAVMSIPPFPLSSPVLEQGGGGGGQALSALPVHIRYSHSVCPSQAVMDHNLPHPRKLGNLTVLRPWIIFEPPLCPLTDTGLDDGYDQETTLRVGRAVERFLEIDSGVACAVTLGVERVSQGKSCRSVWGRSVWSRC